MILNEYVKKYVLYTSPTLLKIILYLGALPIYTRHISPSDYGIMSLYGGVIGIAWLVSNLGLRNSYGRFFFDVYKDKATHDIMLTTYMTPILMLSASIFAIYCIFSIPIITMLKGNIDHQSIFLMAYILSVSETLSSILTSTLVMYDEPKKFAAYKNISIIINVAIPVLLVLLGHGLKGVIVGKIISEMVFVFMVYFNFIGPYKFSFDVLKKGMKFGLPLNMSEYLGCAISQFKASTLVAFTSTTDLGISSMSSRYLNVINQVSGGISNIYGPKNFKLICEGSFINAKDSIQRSMFLTSIIAFISIMFCKDFLVIFTVPAFYAARELIIVSLYPAIFGIIGCGHSGGLGLAKKVKTMAVLNILFMLLSGGISYFFIQHYGVIGMATFAALQSILSTIVYTSLGYKYIKIDLDYLKIWIYLIVLSTVTAYVFMKDPNFITRLSATLLIASVSYASFMGTFDLYDKLQRVLWKRN